MKHSRRQSGMWRGRRRSSRVASVARERRSRRRHAQRAERTPAATVQCGRSSARVLHTSDYAVTTTEYTVTHPEELVDELPTPQQQTHDDEARVEAQLLQHEVGTCNGTDAGTGRGTGSRQRARREDSLRLRKHRGIREGEGDGESRVKQLVIDTGGRLGPLPPADRSGSRDAGRDGAQYLRAALSSSRRATGSPSRMRTTLADSSSRLSAGCTRTYPTDGMGWTAARKFKEVYNVN